MKTYIWLRIMLIIIINTIILFGILTMKSELFKIGLIVLYWFMTNTLYMYLSGRLVRDNNGTWRLYP